MASIPVCQLDGTVLDRKSRPPNVKQVHIKRAAEEYDISLCDHCEETASFADIIRAAEGKPGGTVEGSDVLVHLIRESK